MMRPTRLTSGQRKFLRGQAQHLNPVVQIGKQGVTGTLIEKVVQELDAHELIKIRFLEFKDEKHELAEEIAARSDSSLVTVIGNVAVLYRQHPDDDRRAIILPA